LGVRGRLPHGVVLMDAGYGADTDLRATTTTMGLSQQRLMLRPNACRRRHRRHRLHTLALARHHQARASLAAAFRDSHDRSRPPAHQHKPQTAIQYPLSYANPSQPSTEI
jgi:hypothetical protein